MVVSIWNRELFFVFSFHWHLLKSPKSVKSVPKCPFAQGGGGRERYFGSAEIDYEGHFSKRGFLFVPNRGVTNYNTFFFREIWLQSCAKPLTNCIPNLRRMYIIHWISRHPKATRDEKEISWSKHQSFSYWSWCHKIGGCTFISLNLAPIVLLDPAF